MSVCITLYRCVDRTTGTVVGESNDPENWAEEIAAGAPYEVFPTPCDDGEVFRFRGNAITKTAFEEIMSAFNLRDDTAFAYAVMHLHGMLVGQGRLIK